VFFFFLEFNVLFYSIPLQLQVIYQMDEMTLR